VDERCGDTPGLARNVATQILAPIMPSHVCEVREAAGLACDKQQKILHHISHLFPSSNEIQLYMSFLRRRFGGTNAGNDSPIESREPSPASGQTRPSNLRVITAEQLHTLKNKKGKSKRKNAWIFGLGGLFGLVVAGFFASSNEMIDLKSLENMNLDSILDALPASFVNSAQQLQVSRDHTEALNDGGMRRVLITSTQ
jgi:hypothetical protein